MEPSATQREQRFRQLYDANYLDLLRFVRRRATTSQAEDVVAEVMLVAWRRLDDVPAEVSQARAWLFGVAHKTLQNTRRREDRHGAIAVRLAELTTVEPSDSAQNIAAMVDLAAAWQQLSAVHREAIALAVLDGLNAPQAAAVLGISPTAFRLRLSRARRSLRRHTESTLLGNDLPGDLDPTGSTR